MNGTDQIRFGFVLQISTVMLQISTVMVTIIAVDIISGLGAGQYWDKWVATSRKCLVPTTRRPIFAAGADRLTDGPIDGILIALISFFPLVFVCRVTLS